MGIWSGTKKVAGHLFNVRADKWVGYHQLKGTFNYICFILISLIKPEQASTQESFEEAINRLDLSPDDLTQRSKQFRYWMFLFLGLAIGLLAYAFYLFKQGNLMGVIMSIALMLYASYQTFRFHFWIYQIKKQHLGCTLREWLYDTLRKNT